MQIARPPAPSRRHHKPWRIAALRVCIAVAMAASALGSGAGTISAAGAAPSVGDGFGDAPSIQYQEAMAHANDGLTFAPGEAATVPYSPRLGDTAKIDGGTAVALPAAASKGGARTSSRLGSNSAEPNTAGAATVAGAQASPATANVLRREVYGYLPYWESSAAPTLNYDVLSTVAYFGVGADGAGNLVESGSGWSGWNSSWMTDVINNAHMHGTRVVLTVESFAWTSSDANVQTALLSSSTAQANLITQIVGQVTGRGVDGVSLDFEPIAAGQKSTYVTFVRSLRAALDAAHPGYEIVFDATGYVANYDAANLLAPGGADAVFIMGYGFRSDSSNPVGSIDPLTSPTVYDLTDAVNAYKALAPASSIILGLPYYGIAWSTTSNALNARSQSGYTCPAGGTYPSAGIATYAWASGQAATSGYSYDSVEQSAWSAYQIGSGACQTWAEVYYDDARSLAAKYDMIIYQNLRGAGIWVLGYDGTSHALDSVIVSKFLTDNNPPKAGIVNLPGSQQSEGFQVSWTARDDWNGVKSYDVEASANGGDFTPWLTGTAATSWTFNGASGNSYSFRVRATDSVGNVGPWDVSTTFNPAPTLAIGGFAAVEVTSLNERASATTSAATVRTAGLGTVLQIIGGPVSAEGYTWYQVTGPITELNPVAPVFPGLWIAAANGTTNYVVPITPPNTTVVSAGISNYGVGTPGVAPSGTGIDRGRVFSPDSDGIHDTLPVHWTNGTAFDDVAVSVYRADGGLAGSIDLGAQPAGPESLDWNGRVDGGSGPLADGQYILQVRGAAGATVFYAPSPAPFTASQSYTFGVLIDRVATGTYYPMAPVRILDTRVGLGLSGSFVSGQSRYFQVAGTHGVPAGAIAVTGNLTVTQPSTQGWVRLGSSTSGANSTINFAAADSRANGVTLGLGPDGSLGALYQSSSGQGTVQLIFDLTGYFVRDGNGATFVPVAPTRLVDTRLKQGVGTPLATNRAYAFQVAGLAGVPSNATSVTGNATVTGAIGAGYVSLAPSFVPGTVPGTSSVNFPAGDTRANNVVVPLASGQLQVEYVGKASTSVQFIFDVTGYFVPGLSGSTFVPVAPARLVDSRTGMGYSGPLGTGSAAAFWASGHASIDPVAVAVVGNLTVTGQTSGGWLAAAPGASSNTSTLNFPVGDNRANGFVSMFGSGGSLTVTYGGGTKGSKTQFVVDVMGYYR
jgi:spore germination protein YaaH